jgi:hypothetical protein
MKHAKNVDLKNPWKVQSSNIVNVLQGIQEGDSMFGKCKINNTLTDF